VYDTGIRTEGLSNTNEIRYCLSQLAIDCDSVYSRFYFRYSLVALSPEMPLNSVHRLNTIKALLYKEL